MIPPAMVIAPMESPNAGAGGPAGMLVLGVLQAHGDAGPVPVGEGVVGAPVGVGTELALAGAPHVDDVRVGGPDCSTSTCSLVRTLGSLLVRKTSQVAASL